MILLSFDIGIKNLAYCQIDTTTKEGKLYINYTKNGKKYKKMLK